MVIGVDMLKPSIHARAIATPKIESTSPGGGLTLFCADVGANHPDIGIGDYPF
jgi:hypothetical protein